jgi:hypothetical protein
VTICVKIFAVPTQRRPCIAWSVGFSLSEFIDRQSTFM